MAHHESAKKRIRQIERRTAVNRARAGRVRTYIKKVEAAIADGEKEQAQAALRDAHQGAVVARCTTLCTASHSIRKTKTSARANRRAVDACVGGSRLRDGCALLDGQLFLAFCPVPHSVVLQRNGGARRVLHGARQGGTRVSGSIKNSEMSHPTARRSRSPAHTLQ
jgi:small subunit ribosomal protein S20